MLGPATTQNLVVKFDGEICSGVLVEKMLLTIFPSKRSSKISFQTSPEVRHQFRRKLRQLHSGNRWCLTMCWQANTNTPFRCPLLRAVRSQALRPCAVTVTLVNSGSGHYCNSNPELINLPPRLQKLVSDFS